jgi:putative ABC transport system permease protein
MDLSVSADGILRNVRYTIRSLSRTPGFSAIVVLTLGLGIGANTAVFSAIDAVLLQPLPFPDADRLMLLYQTQQRTAETNIAPARLEDWNQLTSTFEAITGYFTEDASETSGDLPERVKRAFVAPRFLDVWGVSPALGRGFTADEHQAGGPRAVLISDRYWRRRFAADPSVIGKTVRIGSALFPIAGVMGSSFRFPDRDVDLWFPVGLTPQLAQARYATWYVGIGRLKQGVAMEQARADLSAVQARLGDRYPDTDREIGVALTPLKASAVGDIGSSLWFVFGAVCVLLLIACTNIAALLLSRAARRQQEISVRLALGATRTAVTAQILTETGILALVGSGFGLLLAAAAIAVLRSAALELPRIDEVVLDGRILFYNLAIAVTVALLCGLLPALRAARGGAAAAWKDAGRTQVSTRNSLLWSLVGTQVALSVTLLAGAGLLVRSIQELWRVEPGFEASHVLTFRMSGSWAETADYGRLIQRVDGALEEIRAMPGVEAAATSLFLPGIPVDFESTFELVEGSRDPGVRMVAESRVVSPEYFATMQIPLVEGRSCVRQAPGGATELMINRAFATRYLAGQSSVVGLHISTGQGDGPPGRVTGVVGDARERGLDRDPGPVVYSCSSAPNPVPYFLVRTRGDPLGVARPIRARLKALDPLRAVYEVASLESRIGDAFAENRLRTVLLVLFAGTALTLACVGLYGTLSYVVNLRRREVGLRLALGAVRGNIIRQFVGQVLRVAGLACIVGLALAIALARLFASMLYGVSPLDVITLATVVGTVLMVSVAAALMPATRAAQVEPAKILRDE